MSLTSTQARTHFSIMGNQRRKNSPDQHPPSMIPEEKNGGRNVYRQRICCLTPTDEDEFSALLRQNFPEILFFDIDWERRALITYDSIAQAKKGPGIVLPDPRWKPKLVRRYSKKNGWENRFPNRPRKSIWLQRVRIEPVDLSTVEDPKNVVKPIDFKGRRFNTKGQLQGGYRIGHPDEKYFIDKVFRLSAKFMTNAFDIYDLRTGKPIETITKCITWCGPDAIRMCREEEDFVCFVYFRSDLDTWTGYKAIPRP